MSAEVKVTFFVPCYNEATLETIKEIVKRTGVSYKVIRNVERLKPNTAGFAYQAEILLYRILAFRILADLRTRIQETTVA